MVSARTAETPYAEERSSATAYVCGSAGFAEATSAQLVALGVDPSLIRVERSGPTG